MKTPLNNREGKVLRYVTGKTEPVLPDQCVVMTPWSELPKTYLQAQMVLKKLQAEGFVTKMGDGFLPTPAGEIHMKAAQKAGLWDARGPAEPVRYPPRPSD